MPAAKKPAPKKVALGKAARRKQAPPKAAAPQPPALDTAALDSSLGYSLRRAQLSTFQGFINAMSAFDIRPAQFAVLTLIRSNPGLSQSAISDALGIQKANFVALIDRLEHRGLTERRKANGDRRASALHLTRNGELFVRQLEDAHRSHQENLTARLGERRTRQLLKLLHTFTAAKAASE